ncbi:AlpA family phage regulatory protein [Rhodobacteraceae bacterium M385]|nr:AlpA family phage regulatory protein [Rhodobacteraceae bacterium M385]
MTYITLSALSAKLGGRSRSSIYRDVEAGRLPPPIKLGRRIYWSKDAVDRTLTNLTEGA